ncbi:MAG: ribonucleoside-diphosphate reductase alpha chain [Gaiellales bacterium]|nr:ribonucleoside-diphosphate reductase alpha chain [Gaiellales bacterium]
MPVIFDEILFDLELKRAAALDPAHRRAPADARTELPALVVTLAGEAVDAMPLVAEMTRDALAVLATATDGERPGDAGVSPVALVGERVAERLRRGASDAPLELTIYDLSVLVEATLIELGELDLAKALVLCRTVVRDPFRPGVVSPQLIRRSGQVVPWNEAKIERAVRKGFISAGLDSGPAAAIAARVSERVRSLGAAYVAIEQVQDLVQEELVLSGSMRVAERYIVYRAERALLRAGSDSPAAPARPITLREADGRETRWNGEELRERIRFATSGLDLSLDETAIEAELRRSIHDGIGRDDLARLVVLNARTLIDRDADFSRFAARVLLSFVYEEVLDWRIERDGAGGLRAAHVRAFGALLERGIACGRVDERLLEYDLARLAGAIDPTADLDLELLGVQTLYDRYLLVDKSGATAVRIETPQLFWLRVAMGVCLGETGDREARVLELYEVYRSRRFCSSTPTLFNAGTRHPQLSSCYLYVVDDSLESIMQRGIAENAMCSKWAGGLGGSWTAVRGTGSHIGGTNGESQGVLPFLKLHNDQLVAVNQGGKRAGSGCAYLEIWHNDIRDFLELRRGTGDERRRTHDMNTACWIPDLFMQRLEAREHWTLFRSSEVVGLHDLYGAAFERRYLELEQRAAAGELWSERIEALELWKQMLRMLFETGHPWITFKDPCNVRSPQDHAGVVHSSNLCTEITLNTSEDETAVCNLGSIVLDQHLTPDGEIDHARLRQTVRIAVRALDNVIDINFYPTAAARRSNLRNRPVGLGVMGLQYALYRRGTAFASDAAIEFSDEMMEAVAHYAYEASSDLAAERGAYPSYAGSKWDRGLLPQDTLDLLERERGQSIDVPRGGRLDWGPLRARIARQGMRNSNVLAIAPTATIANIVGTSPCIEPTYKNVFAKSNLSGDFVVLNPFLVRDLKAAGLWSPELADQLKYFDGDLEQLPQVPQVLRDRYRTAFQMDQRFLIDAAARRQKWIDQSQSLNLFLPSPDMKAMSHMYRHAWHAGLKTTYYLRTLGASAIEKSTVSAESVATVDPAVACSIEAQRNGEECEACQ